jgi:hypothetical protein
MRRRKLHIEHFTFILSLRTNFAFNYLKFINDLKEIKITDHSNCLSTNKLEKDYLVIYIKATYTESLIVEKLLKSAALNKVHIVVIDELFPNTNNFGVKSKYISNNARWIKGRVFNTRDSYLEVI